MKTLFSLSSLTVMPFWFLMIIAPGWRWTRRILASPLVIAAPAIIYLVLVLPRLNEVWPAVSRPMLEGIAALLGSHAGATIAWMHFLAFDLFVGRWIYLDSRERSINAWLMAPVLFLTLMLGPVGFLLYLLVRVVAARSRAVDAGTDPSFTGKEDRMKVVASHAIKNLRTSLRAAFGRAMSLNKPLTIAGLGMLLVFLVTLVGILLDPRIVTGAPVWLKPAKFAVSISIYSLTFVWLLGFVRGHTRLVRLAANVTVLSFIVEMVIIVTQAARGTTSHFNFSTRLDSVLFMMMGAFIILTWAANLLVGVLLLKQRMPDRVFAWSLRLGIFISAVGMGLAFLMTSIPTPEQRARIAAGGAPQTFGAHSVGVADGGPGLPVVGWSTTGGDLRVAHFVGLHAMQVLPLVGWLLSIWARASSRLAVGHRLSLVWTTGLAYLGLILLLAWQALRGQSVVAPDAATLAAFGALGTVCLLSAVITIAHAVSVKRRQAAGCRHATVIVKA